MCYNLYPALSYMKERQPDSRKPEWTPHLDSITRGTAFLLLGGTIIGIGKVTGDEGIAQTGSTIAVIGGAELFYGLGKWHTK
jgi:hypothetical protein